jgi:hypothetical protein
VSTSHLDNPVSFRLNCEVSMTVKCNALLVGMFAACLVSAQASEVLQPRDLDGNPANGAEAYYDSVQDITWLADWRQGDAGGMTWAGSVAWAAALALGGYEDWRLPAVGLPRCQSFNCLNGELGFLWYVVLGNSAPHLTNRGPFTNMAAGAYWSGTIDLYVSHDITKAQPASSKQ